MKVVTAAQMTVIEPAVGADGPVAARHLRGWGADAVCYLLARRTEHDPKLELARRYDGEILSLPDADVSERLRQQETRLRLCSDAPQSPQRDGGRVI